MCLLILEINILFFNRWSRIRRIVLHASKIITIDKIFEKQIPVCLLFVRNQLEVDGYGLFTWRSNTGFLSRFDCLNENHLDVFVDCLIITFMWCFHSGFANSERKRRRSIGCMFDFVWYWLSFWLIDNDSLSISLHFDYRFDWLTTIHFWLRLINNDSIVAQLLMGGGGAGNDLELNRYSTIWRFWYSTHFLYFDFEIFAQLLAWLLPPILW